MTVSGPAGSYGWGTLQVDTGNTVQIIGASATATTTSNAGTINQTAGSTNLGAISGSGNLTVGNGSSAAQLTATQILQNSLIIGAGSTVMIVPSSSGGSSAAHSSAVASSGSSSATTGSAAVASSDLSSSDSSSGNTDIGAIQSAIDSGEISNIMGEILENRIFNDDRMAAEDPALNVALLDGRVMTELANLESDSWSGSAETGPGTISLDAGPSGFDSGADADLTAGPAAVPEPSSLLLAALGGIGLALALRMGGALRGHS